MSTNNHTNHYCYLLQSESSTSKTYFGYTVDPSKRINQHNGMIQGGASYTSKSRPWKFIAVVHGFKSESDGLKFEWALQHPKKSKLFRNALVGSDGSSIHGSSMHIARILDSRKGVEAKLRLLMILLCESLYKHEELTIFFFENQYKHMFEQMIHQNATAEYSSDSSTDSVEIVTEHRGTQRKWCSELPIGMKAVLINEITEVSRHL